MPYVVVNPCKEIGQKYGQKLGFKEGEIPAAIKFTSVWMSDDELSAQESHSDLEAKCKELKSELSKAKKEIKALSDELESFKRQPES